MRKRWWWLVGGLAGSSLVAGVIIKRHQELQRHRARNRDIHVLILGAGVIGSTYAARLARWGMNVTMLARGERLQELLTHGVLVRDVLTRRWQSAAQETESGSVRVVSVIPPEIEYDLAILAVRFTQTQKALEAVKPLAGTTPVLLMQNNPRDIEPLAETLGDVSLLMGFPATGGALIGRTVYSLPLWLGTTVIGESDGAFTQRLHQTATILSRAGLRVETQRCIVPWLKTHAAMVAVLAGCVYKNGGSTRRMARTAGEICLYLSALREAYNILEANGTPVTPRAQLKIFERPGWLQVASVRAANFPYWVDMVVSEYVTVASDEMKASYDQLMALAKHTGTEAPVLASLGHNFPQ